MSMIPPELILDILSRSPVKSLCRFRCVSKSWLALIKDSRFVELHLAKTQRQRLVLDTKSLFSVDIEMVSNNDDKIFAVELDFPGKKLYPEINCLTCIGSCNGLLCILTEPRYLFLYNPSTKECKQILDFRFPHTLLYGFGYVESIDDYKFVKISNPGKIVEVYSLQKNSWTHIQNELHLTEEPCTKGIPFNGAIYWMLNGQNVIAAFNLVEEKFTTLALPADIITTENDLRCSLGLLNGSLCLTTRKRVRVNEFWIMQEYNMKESSWTKILIVDLFCLRPLCNFLRPLCYLKNSGTMLLYKDTGHLVCNPKDGKLKVIEVDCVRDWFDANVYMESLVSPNYKNKPTIAELPDELQSVQIVVPSLEQFSLDCKGSILIDMVECPNLMVLELSRVLFTEHEFRVLISSFPLLEDLNAINIDAPNLLSFRYYHNQIPVSSMNAPCPWEIQLQTSKVDPNTQWFIKIKEFLAGSNQIKDVFLTLLSKKKHSFNFNECRESSPSFSREIGNLHVAIYGPSEHYAALLDGLLEVCYPRTLFVSPDEDSSFIEWLCKKLMNVDASCCDSHDIKCWRHYLKDFKIGGFLVPHPEDQKPLCLDDLSVDNLKDAFRQYGTRTVRFHISIGISPNSISRLKLLFFVKCNAF
ncbi:hypothetical protein EZV62_008542 [Acer yangbiense]|uniref:F-box domain-containing protein n=1 Tax=Acer yangbiense TaxID=1000413 RepID=A0A5C7IDD5_9ROSI|nr:hypothetical protein EZV62_008542 [Acer yangbiense]